MRRCSKIPYIALSLFIAFVSCSKDNPSEELKEIPKENFELEEKVIGLWEIEDDNVQSSYSNRQAVDDDLCYVSSLIFYVDGTFIVTYTGGTITGNYTVTSEKSISLGEAGDIGNVNFTSGVMYFEIELNGICSAAYHCNRRIDYRRGDCYSFLNCNDNSIWKRVANNNIYYIKFVDHHNNIWFQNFVGWNSEDCFSAETNRYNEGELILIKNNTGYLRYIHQKNNGNAIHSYLINSNGNLERKIENSDASVIYQTFQPSSQEELDNLISKTECGRKTYVPDDVFEQELIDRGLDNIMDNYVLTENISRLTNLYFINYAVNDLTGLEDFVALTHFTLNSSNIKEIDLTSNSLLERVYLSSTELIKLNIDQNAELESLYLEYGKIETIDFSGNNKLKILELHATTISKLDVSKNNKLEMLTVEGGNLNELKFSRNENLWHLNIDNQPLESIDLSFFPNLREIYLEDNNLNGIDVSKCPKLEFLSIANNSLSNINLLDNANLRELFISDNNLSQLDISRSPEVYIMYAENNPGLDCIQIADVHWEEINADVSNYRWKKNDHTEYSTDCGYE